MCPAILLDVARQVASKRTTETTSLYVHTASSEKMVVFLKGSNTYAFCPRAAHPEEGVHSVEWLAAA